MFISICLKCLIRRWYPVVPLGLPHRSLKDEVYRNMLIPKGSTIFANLRSADFTCVESSETLSRGMSLDEKIYKDPEAFNPDRFVTKVGYTPEPFFPSAFGFGRRFDPSFICVLFDLFQNMPWAILSRSISLHRNSLYSIRI